jgi:hypothetical protein
MANMSYCRFQNTAHDLYDCIEALEGGEIASVEEFDAAIRMVEDMVKVVLTVADYTGMNYSEFMDAVCSSKQKGRAAIREGLEGLGNKESDEEGDE